MDTVGAPRDNPDVLGAGSLRRQISQVLSAAYADGLISQDTYVERLEMAMADGLVDRGRLIGDLRLRSSTTGLMRRTLDAGHGWLDRLLSGLEAAEDDDDVMLLALDWAGGEQMLIGRHHSCDIVLAHLEVSRRHCRLFFRDGRWIVHDLGSTNGTFVNGDEVGRCEVRPGDRLRVGAQVLRID